MAHLTNPNPDVANIWKQSALRDAAMEKRIDELHQKVNLYRDMYEELFKLRETERRYYAHKRYWTPENREMRRKEMLLIRQTVLINLADSQLQLSKMTPLWEPFPFVTGDK